MLENIVTDFKFGKLDLVTCVDVNDIILSRAEIIKSTVNVSNITYLSLPPVLTKNARGTFPPTQMML